jgi:EmrB/QacA subfamily drug resistance transporter
MMGATPVENGLEHELKNGPWATGRAPSCPAAADGRRWLALALVCLASLLIVLDGTIVNVALPTIQRDLGFTQASLAWVVNAYLLTFGGLMLVAGRAADLLGRRRILMAGIALFTLSSLACGTAGSQAMLVLFRGLQGIGGAVVASVTLSIVVALFPDPTDRAKAMSIWGFVGSGGGTVGVVVGGLLTQSFNWHWIFLVNVPIGAAALLLAKPLLPAMPGTGMARGIDLPGTLAVIAAPVLAVYGIVNGSQAGWTSVGTLGCLAAALMVAAAFVVIEAHRRAPLVPLRIFRLRTVAVTNIVTVLSGSAFFGWFFFAALYAQRVLGYDSLHTGLTFLPATLTMGGLSLGPTAWIVSRFGPKRPLVAGTLLVSLGLALLGRAPADGQFVIDLLGPMLLLGFGAGISFMPLVLLATGEASPAESGLVSGLVSTSQMIGGAIGLAVLAGVAAARTGSALAAGQAPTAALNAGYHAAFWLAAALALAAALIAASQLHGVQATPPPGDEQSGAEQTVNDGELVAAGS